MMDPMRSLLGRVLLEEITPVVMVLSTPLAEDACRKNGLNFVEMLLPFTVFNKIDVPVRTASDQPYRLQMFKLRLVYASDIRQQDYKVAEDHLKQLVSDAASAALSDLQSEPQELEAILSETELNFCPSWIQTFNKELRKTISFSEHEAFDHPVACLLVVSSNDAQPINRFVDLFNTDQLPSLLNDGVMDPKVLKQYLLLHDNHDGTMDKATAILAEMKSTFGPADCRILCINSSAGGDGELKDNPWLNFKAHMSVSQEIGSFLNIDDLLEIKEFMQELTSKHIIPYMEQKIRFLNQQVSATRKGFRNQIKNLWWRKGKEDAPETASGQMYTFSSTESQIRVLGDYAFILRDYELALSNYRLLSTDYKLDKAWKRYAGVQEMMGLAYFMLDQSRKDSEICMETAFNTYLKLVPLAQRNATRCGLWWAEMLKTRGQYKEAAGIYFRISSEEPPLHAAVMLEQASYSYLFSRPPMLRKYGFHLVLAGNRYYVSDQRSHALRTYRNSLLVYRGIPWNFILDHVHYNIGRWYAFVGIFDVSVKHMLEVLACSHQSVTTQDLFLGNFFQTVENTGKIFEVKKLQLPVLNMSSIGVIYEDHRTYASVADVNVNENLWKSLEEEMIPLTSTTKSNWLESQSKLSFKNYNDCQVCVVGEAIKVYIEFRNPLQIPISISGISLICDLCAKSEVTNTDWGASSFNDVNEELKDAPSCRSRIVDASSLVLSEIDQILGGGEAKRIQLDATPTIEGVLKILGVRWKLSEFVVGYHFFEPNMKKKHKKEKGVARNTSGRILNFVVIKGLPKLEGCIHNLPGTAFAGDLRLLRMELKNQSEYTMKNMRMTISHPRFLIPGNLEDLNKDFPGYLEKQKISRSMDASANVQKFKKLLFYFPNDVTIEGGAILYWPLWFHAGFSGKISLFLSLYYEIENCSSDMIYRTLRMHYDLEVFPSLDVSIQITPCPSKLQEFLVRMDIMNRTSTESFSIQQLSCVGDHLGISTLPANESICQTKVIHAGQALSCFFKLKDCSGSSEYETSLAIHGKSELLDAQCNRKALFDVSRLPLLEFHQHERHHQEKTAKGGVSKFDFILISELQENISTGSHPSILSSHACHCSISEELPVWWLLEGPRVIHHDFCVSFCEIDLELTIYNRMKSEVFIRIITMDFMPETKPSEDSTSDPNINQGGWHDISLANDIKENSNVQGFQFRKSPSPSSSPSSSLSSQSISPFIWCAASSTSVKMQPSSTARVPLRICVFSPGTFDLSNYELHWNVDAMRSSSGISRGHPFYLTVLQSPP
ncbi:trafficking protein particle complex subunit 8 [Phalaenopsis equestris]|uniref:trafficking protein particle complex subunit 8 n=1 Tax=Phalaenopsis equestris TaxID=78828 RepID=UPI0009E5637F|nr:trafficking protein particle complex subunit 8 [Phalaenopsis equestris]